MTPTPASLAPTALIDSDHPDVVAFAREHDHGADDRERAVSMFLVARDVIRFRTSSDRWFGLAYRKFRSRPVKALHLRRRSLPSCLGTWVISKVSPLKWAASKMRLQAKRVRKQHVRSLAKRFATRKSCCSKWMRRVRNS